MSNTVTTDAPKNIGGWTQQLGKGLSGTPGRVTISVVVTGGPPFSFSPNPSLEFHECDDATYSTCRYFAGSGPAGPFNPQHLNEIPIDSTFGADMSAMTSLNPSKYYLLSFGLSIVRGAGTIQVRGSATDSFTHGATDAGGLADIAFTIEGIERVMAPPIATTTTTTPPLPLDPGMDPVPGPAPSEPLVSSVLFLPGFKGSELFRTNSACSLLGVTSAALSGTGCDWKLWLPTADSEVPALFLTPQGESKNPNIYTRPDRMLDDAFGKKFYASFIENMELAESNRAYGTGWQFESAAYDWRLASAAIVSRGSIDTAGRVRYLEEPSLPYLESRIRALASTSPTGKVSIVGHSYGGIVARALTQRLGDGAGALIDSLVLVGTPEHGTPRALGALLFGDREAIPGMSLLPNVMLTSATARTFGLSSPAAYELLPNALYFEHAPESDAHVLRFANQASFRFDRQAYGESVNTRPELLAYATAATIPRTRPNDRDVTRPAILSSYLIANAENASHTLGRALPDSITVHRIAGWGESTLSGFEYRERQRFVLGAPIGSTTMYVPYFTQSGDGAVPYWSAAGVSTGNTHDHRLDLASINRGTHRISHANLLEAEQTQSLIADILRGSLSAPAQAMRFSSNDESLSPLTRLRVLVFSPASLVLRDLNGNETGISTSGILLEDIPNSSYGEIGSYSYVEVVAGQQYEVTIKGIEEGTFSLSLVEDSGSGSTITTSVLDVPATSATVATMRVGSDGQFSALAVDVDGNADYEATIPLIKGIEVPYLPTIVVASPATAEAEFRPAQQDSSGSTGGKPSVQVVSSGTLAVHTTPPARFAPIAVSSALNTTTVERMPVASGAVVVGVPEDPLRHSSSDERLSWWQKIWHWLVATFANVLRN